MEKHPSHPESTLAQWLTQVIEMENSCLKLHLRGNNLHLLCQGELLDRVKLLHRLLPALKKTDLNAFTSADAPQIYQIQLYGCKMGQTHPVWSCTLYLNQLDAHLAQLQQETTTKTAGHQDRKEQARKEVISEQLPRPGSQASPPEKSQLSRPNVEKSSAEKFALALSNRSLARQGHETAIASYLSETLSNLGVAVRVNVKSIDCIVNANVYSTDIIRTTTTAKRLWIACEAPYSPDPSLVGEAITQKLRDLEIEGYRDAVIRFQVAGEAQPDWLLRVDLTPPDEMLREWARWGDIEALQRLLNQAVVHLGAQFNSASLKEANLHLFCTVIPGSPAAETARVPDLPQIRAEIVPLLEMLGPQGIHAVTVYGQAVGQDAPAWLEWLEMPAASHPALADPALTLALQEDWSAVAFLLHRLLNPDLAKYLATGGVRLQLLPRHDLLHIMSEAPLCPDQQQVGQTIVRFLKQLKLPDVAGVRIYGRRAGQKQPLWNYGVDLIARDRLVLDTAPEFAATDTYIGDLIALPDEDALRPDLSPEDIQSAWAGLHRRTIGWMQQALMRSQLFISSANPGTSSLALPDQTGQASKIALVWGIVGALLVVQTNWLLEKMLRRPAPETATAVPALQQNNPAASPSPTPNPSTSVVSSTRPIDAGASSEFPFPDLELPRSADTDAEAFDPKGFTELESEQVEPSAAPTSPSPTQSANPDPASTVAPESTTASQPALPYTPQNPAVNLALAQSLVAEAWLPSFNSRQFNDKLELYYRVLEESGPPDVLVVGSSRALRGVDPTALEQALAELGHADLKVFNFGINGATAQVLDLLLRQMLTPAQLPRVIIWADGARAFNSNAVDVTYNGITASVAYQEFVQGSLQLPQVGRSTDSQPATAPSTGLNTSLTDSYQLLDRWFSQQLSLASNTYADRDQLKHLLQQGMTRLFPDSSVSPPPVTSELLASDSRVPLSNTPATLPANYEFVDAHGFLSLGIQFNPATYYQKYAKVTGDYDRDYLDFQIAGVQETALSSLLEYTQTQKIPVIFVNLPMTDEYLDPARAGYEQQFKNFMVSASLNQPGLQFHDLGEVWLTEYDYFSDPSHLNRYGAYAISQRIAQDPRIAWPKQQD